MEMMLEVAPRAETGKKLKALRDAGTLPGVMYGKKEAPVSLSLSRKVFEKLFSTAGESTIITLKGLSGDKDVLVQDVALDPVTGAAIHVDFYAVESDKLLQVHVPIEFEGEAPVLKAGDAILTKVLHEIEVECLPRHLPQHVTVDVSVLAAIGDTIHVSDIKLPANVTAVGNPEDVVVVASAAVEEVEAPVEAVDMAAIEVEKKGKTEEEGEAAAAE